MKMKLIDDKLVKIEDFNQEELDLYTGNYSCISDLSTYIYVPLDQLLEDMTLSQLQL